jgi:TonB family protein
MRGLIACLFSALFWITCFSSSADAAATPLESTKPWVLDYGPTQCTAMRKYGDSDRSVTLAIIPALSGDNYELVATYARRAPQFAEEFKGTVDFGARRISVWGLKYGDGNLALYQFRLSSNDMAQARSASVLAFGGELDVSFRLENMPELLDGLQKCTADLEDFWNDGGEKNGRIAVPSRGDFRNIFSANDYPAEASRRMQRGTAQYVLLIDEKGSVAGCHVLKPSGVPALDSMGCLVIQERSKLTPAKDRAGNAVRSTLVTPPIAWRLEGP